MPNPASSEIRAQVLQLRRCGWSCLDVGLELGVSPQAVGRWSKLAGIKVHAYTPRSVPVQERVSTYSAALDDCWPLPVPLPSGAARTVRGVLHTETDGSEPRHA